MDISDRYKIGIVVTTEINRTDPSDDGLISRSPFLYPSVERCERPKDSVTHCPLVIIVHGSHVDRSSSFDGPLSLTLHVQRSGC